jgi:hypothetical protein
MNDCGLYYGAAKLGQLLQKMIKSARSIIYNILKEDLNELPYRGPVGMVTS